jgi:tetratricopeptide (TPR) repeat protein
MPKKIPHKSVEILRARAEKTQHPKTLKKLILALHREKQYEECILWSQHYINRSENDSIVLMTCAECYYALENYTVSLQYSARALALQIEGQNKVLDFTPPPEQVRLIAIMRRMLMVDVLTSRYNCFAKLNKLDEAYEIAVEIAELGSYDPVFWFAIFEYHKNRNTLSPLRESINNLLTNPDTDQVIIHTIKGLIHIECGEFDDALCEFAHTDPHNDELNSAIAHFRAQAIMRMNDGD